MSVIYTNFNSTPTPSTTDQEYSFTFTTGIASIPSSNYFAFNSKNDLMSEMQYATLEGLLYGFFSAAANYSLEDAVFFANENAIVLPSEIGGTVEGSLQEVVFDSNAVMPEPKPEPVVS